MMRHTIEDQLILHEGLRLEIYKCPAGKWTIGVGRNLEDVGLSRLEMEWLFGRSDFSRSEVINKLKTRRLTREEAVYLLENDIAVSKLDLAWFPWFKSLDPVRQKVMIDLRFNIGPNSLRGFTKMLAAMAQGDYNKAADEMVDSKWYHEVGTRSKRLVAMMRTGLDYEK